MPRGTSPTPLHTLLGTMIADYYEGGAEDETTLQANIAAWSRTKLVPRIAGSQPSHRPADILPGTPLATPLMLAPCALAKLAHPDGESAVARAATAHKIPFIVSTTSSETLEQTAANAPGASLWFQLYAVPDRAVTADLISRAQASNYRALVLTVDTPALGRRERDQRNRFALPPDIRIANLERYGNSAYDASRKDPALTWEILEWIRQQSRLPVVLKGILDPRDAQSAVDHGADAIIVSNHGGRQLDGAPATADILLDIVQKVAGQIPVLVDGGIRRGSHVAKALQLGADAALIGRPWLRALAHGGEDGVRNYVANILDEIRVAGITTGSAAHSTAP
jgi:isopentenyl diphosphate isomerase/L-lactate dehydrogenase-like FMN-dependent dehydrogenase